MASLPALALGPGREFDMVRDIVAALGPAAAGVGDDCALLALDGGTFAATVDCSIEGVHFRVDWLTPEEIGWRAAAAALSDLAADGARPLGVLVSLAVPASTGRGDAPEIAVGIMRGVGSAVAAVGGKVLGGDLARFEKIVIDVCALGTVERAVRRAGARAGDGLWVTGALGGARLAMRTLQLGQAPEAELRARFARPEPRIAAGRWLAQRGATAMIDVSDGLASDARHLAAASAVALDVALEHIPCWVGADALLAASSGEEYELLVTLPETFGPADAQAFEEFHGLPLTRIGAVRPGEGVRFTDRGTVVTAPGGWDHFA
jgi:thiamine-monophosphate kinase